MKQVIFVCTGNTCRSPMAEVIAKHLCKTPDLHIFSRGIFVSQNTNANINSINAVEKYNLSLKNHVSTQLTEQDLKEATLILTMSSEHKKIICENFKNYNNKIFTIYEYTKNSPKNIEDPYGLPLNEYIACFNELFNLIETIDFNKI